MPDLHLPTPCYDEQRVPAHALPPLLVTETGQLAQTPAAWRTNRRPELLELFRRHVYGRFDASFEHHVDVVVERAPACGGLALRTELDLRLFPKAAQTAPVVIRLLIFTPSKACAPSPTFIGLNLFGNQTLHADPGIRLSQGWLPENADLGLLGNVATEASRGMHSGRAPIEMLVARGYALATAYAGDVSPDLADAFTGGVHRLREQSPRDRAGDFPGAIAAWAFGLSCIRQALAERPDLDPSRAIVFGHSRLGKAALWAAAQDEAFALAISNQSGCGGATISRRCFGETLLHINQRFPHWFCPAFHAFNGRENELPVDQHQLLALVAPRPLCVGSAAGDLWADPRGERLACEAATPAYELHGVTGLTSNDQGHLGYHVRPGRHDITPRDFWHYLEFADRRLGSSPGAEAAGGLPDRLAAASAPKQ
jgi:hypothetical protein